MPAHRLTQTRQRTRLAQKRCERDLTQEEMVTLTGISRTSYLSLERGTHRKPLDYLGNCALVLGCQLEDLIEPGSGLAAAIRPEHRVWKLRDARHPCPERPEELWRGRATSVIAARESGARKPTEAEYRRREMEYARFLEFREALRGQAGAAAHE